MVPRNFLKINNLNLQDNSQFTCYETSKPILIILCQVDLIFYGFVPISKDLTRFWLSAMTTHKLLI